MNVTFFHLVKLWQVICKRFFFFLITHFQIYLSWEENFDILKVCRTALWPSKCLNCTAVMQNSLILLLFGFLCFNWHPSTYIRRHVVCHKQHSFADFWRFSFGNVLLKRYLFSWYECKSKVWAVKLVFDFHFFGGEGGKGIFFLTYWNFLHF